VANSPRTTPLDQALAALCEATREAVAELEAESDGFFDGCPLCGKPAYMHAKETE